MKYLLFLLSGLVAVVLAVLTATPAFAQDQDFCWKDTTTRGVGEVPASCDSGRERLGLLCYSACPANMVRAGVDCHSVCPDGMRDDGLFCRAAEYGRGAGYVWEFGDPAFSDSGMFARCERDNGAGNCELDGLIVYPKCKPGYEKFGSNICRPAVPDCEALGLRKGLDLSCAKAVIVGDPVVGACGPGQQMDAGLCYPSCPQGYEGVGPVCWVQAPKGWVNCGMGAAKDDETCANIVFDQVSSVGEMALFVATLGSSSAATEGTKASTSASRLAKMKQTFTKMKAEFEDVRKNTPVINKALKALDKANEGVQGYVSVDEALDTAMSAMTEEDMARAAAQIAAILDPSGASGIVAAYTYPICSKYGLSPELAQGSDTESSTTSSGDETASATDSEEIELAYGQPATQSSLAYDGFPEIGVDGDMDGDNSNGGHITHTDLEDNPWWQVDLGSSHAISSISIWNRTDCCQERLSDFFVFVSDSDMSGSSYGDLIDDPAVWTYTVEGQAPEQLDIPVNTTGRYVRIQLQGTDYLSLAEVQVWGKSPAGDGDSGGDETASATDSEEIELAYGQPATQSSLAYDGFPEIGVDGDIDGDSSNGGHITHTDLEDNPWWQVDLGDSHAISSISIWNRTDCCQERLSDFFVFVSDSDMSGSSYGDLIDDPAVWTYTVEGQAPEQLDIPVNTTGRYVRIQLQGTDVLSLAEVQVWGQ